MDNTAPLEGLERSERAENLINRKIIIFYIEAIPQKISHTPIFIFFARSIKIFQRTLVESDNFKKYFLLKKNWASKKIFFFGAEIFFRV